MSGEFILSKAVIWLFISYVHVCLAYPWCFPPTGRLTRSECCGDAADNVAGVGRDRGNPGCFDSLFTYERCCLDEGIQQPQLDYALVGFPTSGTTSMARYLESSNVTLLQCDDDGTISNTTEMRCFDSFASIYGKARRLQPRNRILLKNPLFLYSHDKITVLSAIPRLKFIVMLRDPISWFASSVCKQPCDQRRLELGLCSGSNDERATMSRAPLAKWFQVCQTLNDWSPCTGLPVVGPFFAKGIAALLALVRYDPNRLVVLSLESIMERPRESIDALFDTLGVRRLQSKQPLHFWNTGRHTEGFCAAHRNPMYPMALEPELVAALSSEYRVIANVLKEFGPQSLPLPQFWRSYCWDESH
eukprot:gnl/TRDRNA2_/TRDRNA2_200768_c0_seq1.p1 gnl/TRDRNA2_/TRDRNA2_200768_c0~~gnl/TRDRNA2_/TRDRNA2_200768_c0_seq1.p1  ORF type:complete len:360 (-),score=16.41 gnl/TRDRNA2_/TRDRNA2_200768_c0_seq1:67-1146(-)